MIRDRYRDRDRDRKIFLRPRPRSKPKNFETKNLRPIRETIKIEAEIEIRIFFVKKFNFINDINFYFSKNPKLQYILNKLASPSCYKKALLYMVT